MNAIQLDHLTLSVRGAEVLSDISLAVGEGEFVGVLGANGAGKTTLFRAILGLNTATAGAITVLGRPATRGNPAIGYLPQVRTAPPQVALAGRDFLAASIDGHRFGLPFPSRSAQRDIDRVLDLVQARELAERPLSQMSGGERQRLLIAEALIGAPKLLLLDEPLIGLDPRQQQVVVQLVHDLGRELKLTVLFSAHELNQLLGAIDRVLYLGHGRAALGTVDDVITPEVLTPLYGAPIDVIRAGGHIFVMSRGQDVERGHAHDHEHDHHHHGSR
ncbi:MAG TPA: ATP-binding cassette domain-containing protein [Bauldia sp.]|nr:ATP-binding cassette domain-containing protein [Bauldia sp.]